MQAYWPASASPQSDMSKLMIVFLQLSLIFIGCSFILKNFPKSLTVNRGESAAFVTELEAGAADPINATWMKDGKVVKEQPMKIRLSCKKTIISLDISDCGEADAGQYACIVSNKKGEVKAAFSLNVH
jgi:hypothetical protein